MPVIHIENRCNRLEIINLNADLFTSSPPASLPALGRASCVGFMHLSQHNDMEWTVIYRKLN